MSAVQDQLQRALGSAYRLERELGGGGMSHVYLAEEVALGRRVVIKVLPPDMAASVSVDRFRREIQLAAQLQHPGIVPLLTAGADGDLLWYVMPYVEGESLRTRLARGPLPIDEAVRLWRDLLEALEYAHGRGIVHRDIKPENIMLTGRRAVTLDFGVAKAVTASTGSSGMTMTGVGFAIGTPAYMAPEQAAGDGSVDARADLYAAGLVLYEMLAGRGPFEARTPAEMMAAQIATAPTDIRARRPEVGGALAAMLMACLAKAPEQRPANAAAALRRLEHFAVPVPASTSTRSLPQMPRALVVAALLCIVGAFTWWRTGAGRGAVSATQASEATLPDSSRLQVALLPVIAESRDSVLARTLISAQVSRLQSAPTLLTNTPGQIRALAEDLDISPIDPDSLRHLYRELGVHTYVQHTLARSGEGVLLIAEGFASKTDSALFRIEKPIQSSVELSTATNALVEEVTKSLELAVGRVAKPTVTGRILGTTPDAAALYLQALPAFAAGAYAQSLPLLRAALRADPQFAMAWSQLGAVNNNSALSEHERFIGQKNAYLLRSRIPSRVRRAFEEITYLRIIGELDSALAVATRASAEFPDNLLIKNQLSNIHLAKRNYRIAAQVTYPNFERALATRMSAVGVENYIFTAAEAGQLDTARAALNRAEAVFGPTNLMVVIARERLGALTLNPDSLSSASQEHLRLARESADQLTAYGRLAAAMVLSGRVDSAIRVEAQRRATASAGGHSRVLVSSLAQEAYVRATFLGTESGAAERLDSALRAARWDTLPALDRNFGGVIRAFVASQDIPSAKRYLDEWQRTTPVEVVPSQRPLWEAAKGEIALATGDSKAAIRAFHSADVGRCEACAAARLARAFDQATEADSAIFWYERTLAHPSGIDLARDAFDEFLRAYRRLGELYEAKGDAKRAIQRYSDFVELWKNADPALQPLVKDVRERIARLQRKSG
jgi:serine/threonine protein kinase/tetratricopeptide (TPR) repeat protein